MGEVSSVVLLLLSLSTYRLVLLLGSEDGPWYVLERLRHLAGVREDKSYGGLVYGTNEFARGLLCPSCLSLWVGLISSLCYLVWPVSTLLILLPFAVSGGSVLLRRLV